MLCDIGHNWSLEKSLGVQRNLMVYVGVYWAMLVFVVW